MFIVQCCVCGKVRLETQWTYIPKKKIESSTISHTYCPECANAFIKQINNFYSRENKSTLTCQTKKKQ